MKDLKVGDLVRDKLNEGEQSYGLGIVIGVGRQVPEEDYPKHADDLIAGNRYNVYFTRFGKTIEFHGDYLERV
jgi:hypothetical protein